MEPWLFDQKQKVMVSEGDGLQDLTCRQKSLSFCALAFSDCHMSLLLCEQTAAVDLPRSVLIGSSSEPKDTVMHAALPLPIAIQRANGTIAAREY